MKWCDKMKKNKIIIVITIILCLIVVALFHFWILPSRYEKECKNRIFKELDEETRNIFIKDMIN